jgi:hypothetical protein
MKTPTSAADFADTSDSMPAAPASNATTNDSGPTWTMKSTSDWLAQFRWRDHPQMQHVRHINALAGVRSRHS